MQIQTKRTNEVKHFARVRGKGGKRVNLPIYHVNFETIEDMPRGKLEEEILRKVTIAPSQLDSLLQEEEQKVIAEVIKHAKVPRAVKKCLDLYFQDHTWTEISRMLGIGESTVRWYIKRSAPAVNDYLRKNYPEYAEKLSAKN